MVRFDSITGKANRLVGHTTQVCNRQGNGWSIISMRCAVVLITTKVRNHCTKLCTQNTLRSKTLKLQFLLSSTKLLRAVYHFDSLNGKKVHLLRKTTPTAEGRATTLYDAAITCSNNVQQRRLNSLRLASNCTVRVQLKTRDFGPRSLLHNHSRTYLHPLLLLTSPFAVVI